MTDEDITIKPGVAYNFSCAIYTYSSTLTKVPPFSHLAAWHALPV